MAELSSSADEIVLTHFIVSDDVERSRRLHAQRLSRRQALRTVAGMVAVITGVLAGSTVALLVAVVTSHSLAAALISGGAVAVGSLLGLMEYQRRAWVLSD
jgi:hypothetical protein